MKALSRNKKAKFVPTVTENRRVSRDYTLYESFQAGLVLQGWEVKAVRARQVNLQESYLHFYGEEAFLVGANFTPPKETCTHEIIQPTRARKILLNQKELLFLRQKVQRAGYTLVVKKIYWTRQWIKCSVHLAKGKKLHDVRASDSKKDWEKDRAQMVKNFSKNVI